MQCTKNKTSNNDEVQIRGVWNNALHTFPGQSLSRTDVSRTTYTKEFHLFSCTRSLTPGSVSNSTGYCPRTGKLPPVCNQPLRPTHPSILSSSAALTMSHIVSIILIRETLTASFECALHNPVYWSQKQVQGNSTALMYSTEDLEPVRAHVINPNTATVPASIQLTFLEHQVCGRAMTTADLRST